MKPFGYSLAMLAGAVVLFAPAESLAQCGVKWHPLGSGVSANAYDVAGWNGQIAVTGHFLSAGGVPANYIATWDGSKWQALGSGMSNYTYCVGSYKNELIVGGGFIEAGGVTVNCIARWDGAKWNDLAGGTLGPEGGSVTALTVYKDELVASGYFVTFGGKTYNHIARWDGLSWKPLGTGLSNGTNAADPRTLTVYNSTLIVGGKFSHAGGLAAKNIAAWNGSEWSALGGGLNYSETSALTVYKGELIAGGTYQGGPNPTDPAVMRWNGSAWSPLGPGFGQNSGDSVHALCAHDDSLIVGGTFNTPAPNIARWDGSQWHAIGSGTNGNVWGLASVDGLLYAAGSFTVMNGTPTAHVARASFCPADINGDGKVGQTDLGILLGTYGSFVAPCTFGDVDGDSDVDQADLGMLLAVYGQACP